MNGSNTTFGDLTVEVIPGTTVVVGRAAPTLTVEFPEPDSVTTESTIVVSGLVTDDVALAGVTVNGVAATLLPTGNPDDPAERSFSATIALVGGPNTLVTVATDTADPANSASDTRTVTLANLPPVADAGDDQAVEQQGPAGAEVTLDGSRSSDPDGDTLTYAWSGPFGAATGPSPAVFLAAGTHVATLVVNDGTVDSSPDTVTVTVSDTTPPDFTTTPARDGAVAAQPPDGAGGLGFRRRRRGRPRTRRHHRSDQQSADQRPGRRQYGR